MSFIQEKYKECCAVNSDIFEHLPVLHALAKECKTICEMGVRNAVSVYAFAAAKPEKLICVDIKQQPGFTAFINACKNENINIVPIIADSRNIVLEKVDLLFIDTLHTYGQLITELNVHHKNVNKYIVLHDTVSYGYEDESTDYGTTNPSSPTGAKGLVPAVNDFLTQNKEWYIYKTYTNNNGITILAKT